MIQGSTEWHEWRRKGVCASDAAAVIGMSQYSTPYDIWLVKTGRKKDFEGNYATERGSRLEPKARIWYEFQTGIDMVPECVEWDKNPIFRASLDGRNRTKRAILEIKCPGEKNHLLNVNGIIQDMYRVQMEHQLLCTGDDYVHFLSYWEPDGEEKTKKSSQALLTYKSDQKLREKLLEEIPKFWEFVVKDTPPPLGEGDVLVIETYDPMLAALVKAHDELKYAEEAYDKVKEAVLSQMTHPKVKCGRVSISGNRVTISKGKAT